MSADGPKFKAYVDQQRLSKIKLAEALGMTKQNLFQLFKSKDLKQETKEKIEKALKVKWEKVNSVNIDQEPIPLEKEIEKIDLSSVDQSQPIIQVVLNLSYIGRKNADSMDKMAEGVKIIAATNQQNTNIIAALVNAILPSSNLSPEVAASLSSQQIDEDLPVEAFLGKHGADAIRRQMDAGKKKKVGN